MKAEKQAKKPKTGSRTGKVESNLCVASKKQAEKPTKCVWKPRNSRKNPKPEAEPGKWKLNKKANSNTIPEEHEKKIIEQQWREA